MSLSRQHTFTRTESTVSLSRQHAFTRAVSTLSLSRQHTFTRAVSTLSLSRYLTRCRDKKKSRNISTKKKILWKNMHEVYFYFSLYWLKWLSVKKKNKVAKIFSISLPRFFLVNMNKVAKFLSIFSIMILSGEEE